VGGGAHSADPWLTFAADSSRVGPCVANVAVLMLGSTTPAALCMAVDSCAGVLRMECIKLKFLLRSVFSGRAGTAHRLPFATNVSL
jgi:hypothetical protein